MEENGFTTSQSSHLSRHRQVVQTNGVDGEALVSKWRSSQIVGRQEASKKEIAPVRSNDIN